MTCTLNSSLPQAPTGAVLGTSSFNPAVYVSYVKSVISCLQDQISIYQSQLASIKQPSYKSPIAYQNRIFNYEDTLNKDIYNLQQKMIPYQDAISISSIQSQISFIMANLSTIPKTKTQQLLMIQNLNDLLNYLNGNQSPSSTNLTSTVQSVQSNSSTPQTSSTSQVIPTSNNQYPSASIPKTPESQTSSTSQASIQNVSMLSRIYDFVSLYRDYFIGFLIVAMVIVVLIGKGKKHE